MKKLVIVLMLSTIFFSCQPGNQPAVDTKDYFAQQDSGMQSGNIKFVEVESFGKKFKVWTKRFGNNPKTRILLLNGGPGATHEYFECFENFLPQEGIEFIYYDQLGCGLSDNPNDSAYC